MGSSPGGRAWDAYRSVGYCTDAAASRITRVVASGREICGTWEDRTSLVFAPARSAMNRSVAGGMAWSLLATRYQDGIVFQAGPPEGSPSVAASSGRCSAAITAAVLVGMSAQNTSWNALGVM